MSPEVGLDIPDQAILNVYKDSENKYKFYSNKLLTEGVFIKLNVDRLLQWLKENIIDDRENQIFSSTNDNASIDFFNNLISTEVGNQIIHTVIHTISHILLKEIASASGLEATSISEMIFSRDRRNFHLCNI